MLHVFEGVQNLRPEVNQSVSSWLVCPKKAGKLVGKNGRCGSNRTVKYLFMLGEEASEAESQVPFGAGGGGGESLRAAPISGSGSKPMPMLG